MRREDEIGLLIELKEMQLRLGEIIKMQTTDAVILELHELIELTETLLKRE